MPINAWPLDPWRDEDEPDFFARDEVAPDPTVEPEFDHEEGSIGTSRSLDRIEARQRAREHGEAKRRHNQRLHDGGC
jgi:hypothetical protein